MGETVPDSSYPENTSSTGPQAQDDPRLPIKSPQPLSLGGEGPPGQGRLDTASLGGPSFSSAASQPVPPVVDPVGVAGDAFGAAPVRPSDGSVGGVGVRGSARAGADSETPARSCGGGPEGAAPTGLVLEGRLEPEPDEKIWTLRSDECPLDEAYSIDRTNGEIVFRPTCKNARCPRCSRQVSARTFALARRLADIHAADSTWVRFITLTQAPEGWDETRHAMKMWLKNLRRLGYEMHVLWVVERGSETGMKHVHVIQWGSFLPISVLEASWPHGSTQIAAARSAAADYLSKGVIKYVAKELDGDGQAIEAHMNLNGGRAAHWSREFFLGVGRDDFGKAFPIPGHYFTAVVPADRRAS